MPIYEYVCDECGERFEVFQRSRNTPEAPHAECGGTGRRVMSQTSFALKGSGWYRDHYGLKSSASTEASGSGGAAASTSSTASTSSSASSASAASSGSSDAKQGGGGSEKSGSSDTKAAGKKTAA